MNMELKQNFEKDEALDAEFLQALLAKENNLVKQVSELQGYLTKKYGHEFGGFVKIKNDLVDGNWMIDCGSFKKVVEKEETVEIPSVVRYFREQAAKKKK